MSDGAAHATLVSFPLDTEFIGARIVVMDRVASTNTSALRLGGDGTLVIADQQTAGRGRRGRAWHSVPGLGLWFSVAFESLLPGISFAASLAVRDALQTFCPTELKWPNDVLIHGKKVCGVLVEQRGQRVALGIGINVCHRAEDFPEVLRETATSLEMVTGQPIDRREVLRVVLTRLDERIRVLKQGCHMEILEEWLEASNLRGRRIRAGEVEGSVTGLDPSGALILLTNQGERRVISGEIAPI
jgi:BirA family biotin operon repressor/biotin-[acetyl-CoA-carboxylase] ligase